MERRGKVSVYKEGKEREIETIAVLDICGGGRCSH